MAPRKLPRKLRHKNSVRCTVDFAGSDQFAAGDTVDTRRWVHVATAGVYKGYRGGTQSFEFTRETFDQMVANIRGHEQFSAGADGAGDADIIPWDFEHQNDPEAGNVALQGLPAHGWTSDLKVQVETAVHTIEGQKTKLLALTRLLEPALTYVIDKKYRQCSVDMAFDVMHPKSAEPMGAVLFAIALTNRPFIEDLDGLAASHNFGYFDNALTPADAYASMRRLFGLGALTQPQDLMAQLGQLLAYVSNGNAPLGVDVEEIVGCLRQILALPALSPAPSVLDEAGQIVQRLVAESGPQTLAAPKENRMDPKKLIALAALLQCTATEEAIDASIAEHAALRSGLVTSFKLRSRDSNSILLEAVGDAQGATDKLTALLHALGVEDVEGGVKRIADLMQASTALEAAMPELAALREAKAATETEEIEEEVEEAMASYSLPDSCKPLMLASRKGDAKKFALSFPKKAAPAAAATTQLSAKQKLSLTTSVTATGATRAAAGDAVTGRTEGHVYLSDYEGRNPVERAIAYLTEKRPGFANLSWEAKNAEAFKLKRLPTVHLTAPASC